MNFYEERAKNKLEQEGYTVLTRGCPDLIAFKTVDGQIDPQSVLFLEVKGPYDKLSEHQVKFIELLKALHLECVVDKEPRYSQKRTRTKDKFTLSLGSDVLGTVDELRGRVPRSTFVNDLLWKEVRRSP